MGVVLGATSLIAGYVLHKLSQMRSQELSYLHHVPQFRDLKQLKDHLRSSPNQRADVLIEGKAEKLDKVLTSDKSGLEGAAKLLTTTTYSKVYHEESQNPKWRDMSNTIENVNVSVPFKLVDTQGNTVTVQSVHTAGGFRQVLERVWQEKTGPDSRSFGDYATNMTVKEIPNGTLTREFLLVFGTSIGAYGNAVLQNQSYWSGGEVSFTPVEVNSSIHSLISRNEMIVNSLKLFSLVFLVGGGGILFITAVPLLLKFLGMTDGSLERLEDEEHHPLPLYEPEDYS